MASADEKLEVVFGCLLESANAGRKSLFHQWSETVPIRLARSRRLLTGLFKSSLFDFKPKLTSARRNVPSPHADVGHPHSRSELLEVFELPE
jgi:hypothetical protein